MFTTAEIAEHRADAESLMWDTCTIRRPIGETTDPVTGAVVTVYDPTPVYSGKCRVRMLTSFGSDVRSGEQTATLSVFETDIPAAAPGAHTNDQVTVDTSEDQDLTGRTLRVKGPYGSTISVRRRYMCEESTTP